MPAKDPVWEPLIIFDDDNKDLRGSWWRIGLSASDTPILVLAKQAKHRGYLVGLAASAIQA